MAAGARPRRRPHSSNSDPSTESSRPSNSESLHSCGSHSAIAEMWPSLPRYMATPIAHPCSKSSYKDILTLKQFTKGLRVHQQESLPAPFQPSGAISHKFEGECAIFIHFPIVDQHFCAILRPFKSVGLNYTSHPRF